MPVDLPFACQCGAVEGVLKNVSPQAGKRLTCYCDDCQAYIYHLGREADFLGERGANDVFQTTPARLSFTKGADKVVPLQMTGKGVYRWHTTCCRTPIAATLHTPKIPFVGMHTALFDAPSRDVAFGPVRGSAYTEYAQGGGDGLKSSSVPGLILDFVLRAAGARIRGAHRQNPFFKKGSAEPIAEPRRVSAEERAAADARMRQAA